MNVKTKKGSETQARLLDHATALFAEHGFLGVSLREIMTAAEVNFASTHYYFGSKQALYEAAVSRFFDHIDAARRSQLAIAIETQSGVEDTFECAYAILLAYAQPHYDIVRMSGGKDYLRMISRYQSEPSDVTRNFLLNMVGPTRRTFVDALGEVLEPIDRQDLLQGFGLFVNAMVAAPADESHQVLGGRKISQRMIREEMAKRVARFGAAGLCELREK